MGDVDDKYAEFEMRDDCDEGTDRETNGNETCLFDVEELIKQLRVCNSALNMPSDVTIYLDRYAHPIRRRHMDAAKHMTTITSHFKSNN